LLQKRLKLFLGIVLRAYHVSGSERKFLGKSGKEHKNTPAVKKSSRWGNKWRPLKHSVMQRYAFPLKPPNYLPKNFFLNKSLINRDLLGNALRKGSRSLSICMPTSLTVAPAPFFVLLMFLLLFSISVIFYWFSIYSQKVALLDPALLRVLAWSAILLAGLAFIYQARQGVVFVTSM